MLLFQAKEIPQDIANIKSADKALEMSFFIEIADEEYKNKFIEFIKAIIEFLKIKRFKRTIAEQLLKKYTTKIENGKGGHLYKIRLSSIEEDLQMPSFAETNNNI